MNAHRSSRSLRHSQHPLRVETLESRFLLAADYVVHISIDGLGGPYLPALLQTDAATGEGDYSNYLRLTTEGSYTFNARTDFSNTLTLPNHVSMLTGRPVTTPDGQPNSVAHGWTRNTDPAFGTTIHNNNPNVDYIASVFDVVHDAGFATALYATKTKFSLFASSYNTHGAPDTNDVGGDNGSVKIDAGLIDTNVDLVLETMLDQLRGEDPANYTFFHSLIPDAVGHGNGWGSDIWNEWIKRTDFDLGLIFDAVESSPLMNGKTSVILTTDHGGVGFSHLQPDAPESYTIPFFLWGTDVPAGEDLYGLYSETVTDPGDARPDYNASAQPIRNGDSANLALELLGLPNIPGSSIDSLTTCDEADCDTEPTDPTDPDPPDPDPPIVDRPPQVARMILNGDGGRPNQFHSVEFEFDKDVSASVSADDLSLRHRVTNRSILLPSSSKVAGRAEWRFESLDLAPGFYTVTLNGTGVADTDGLNLDGNGDGIGGDSWQDVIIIAAPGDANVDGVVDTRDYQIIRKRRSSGKWTDGDFDASGTVNDADLTVWIDAKFLDLRPKPVASNRPSRSAATLENVKKHAVSLQTSQGTPPTETNTVNPYFATWNAPNPAGSAVPPAPPIWRRVASQTPTQSRIQRPVSSGQHSYLAFVDQVLDQLANESTSSLVSTKSNTE